VKPREDRELIELIKITGELYNKNVSTAAALAFLSDLENFNSADIKRSLQKCRQQLQTFPTVAHVIERIEDGRPGAEEAWALLPKNEGESVVWTEETSYAYGICKGLIKSDPVAARMAFKETYTKRVAEARNSQIAPRWTVSLGFDRNQRNAALKQAVSLGRLDHGMAMMIDAHYEEVGPKKLTAPEEERTEMISRDQALDNIRRINAILKASMENK